MRLVDLTLTIEEGLQRNILIIENLINLNKIGEKKFYFIGLPLKIKGATGSPIRAVAITK